MRRGAEYVELNMMVDIFYPYLNEETMRVNLTILEKDRCLYQQNELYNIPSLARI
jgi:hypothetical protein